MCCPEVQLLNIPFVLAFSVLVCASWKVSFLFIFHSHHQSLNPSNFHLRTKKNGWYNITLLTTWIKEMKKCRAYFKPSKELKNFPSLLTKLFNCLLLKLIFFIARIQETQKFFPIYICSILQLYSGKILCRVHVYVCVCYICVWIGFILLLNIQSTNVFRKCSPKLQQINLNNLCLYWMLLILKSFIFILSLISPQ